MQSFQWLWLIPMGIHLAWYLLQWYAITKLKSKDSKSGELPISLIIAARNEAENLIENIPKWFEQSHPDFEVVVVNDRSVDETFDVLLAFKAKYPKLKVVEVFEYQGTINYGKKYALTLGIKAANHNQLVFTDADCQPSDSDFLKRFDAAFKTGKNMVIGFGGFWPIQNTTNLFYRVENARIALNYFTMGWLKMPFMAVGRSFGYTKDLFYQMNGFRGHQDVASGDDDLFVQKAKSVASIALLPNAATISHTPSTMRDWLRQKKRHNSTAKRYTVGSLIGILLIELVPVVSLISIVGLLLFVRDYYVLTAALLLLLIRQLVYHFLLNKMLQVSQNTKQHALLFALEPLLCAWNNLFSSLTLITRPVEWKKRI